MLEKIRASVLLVYNFSSNDGENDVMLMMMMMMVVMRMKFMSCALRNKI